MAAEYDNSIVYLDSLSDEELVRESHRRHDHLVSILDDVERVRGAVESISEAALERLAPDARRRSIDGVPVLHAVGGDDAS